MSAETAEERIEALVECLKEARGVIVELKAAVEEADLNGEIVDQIIAADRAAIFRLQLECEKLRRAAAERSAVPDKDPVR